MKPTAEQQTIYDFIKDGKGHGIVDAVAGSGKTTAIVQACGIIPEGKTALYCAFNKSLGIEVGNKFIGSDRPPPKIKTIHALGHELLHGLWKGQRARVDMYKLGRLTSKLVEDELQTHCASFVENHPKNGNVRKYKLEQRFKTALVELAQKVRIRLMKPNKSNFAQLAKQYHILNENEWDKELTNPLFEATIQLLKKAKEQAIDERVIDFEDMLCLPHELGLASRKQYDFIFIDECQDLSEAQLETIFKFAHRQTRVMAVGDPFQSIYGFTGASPDSFNAVRGKLNTARKKTLQEFGLSQCFRCPMEVLELASVYREGLSSNKQRDNSVKWLNKSKLVAKLRAGDLVIARSTASIESLASQLIAKGKPVDYQRGTPSEFVQKLRRLFIKRELDSPKSFENQEDLFDRAFRRNLKSIEEDFQDEKDDSNLNQEAEALRKRITFLKERISVYDGNKKTISGLLEWIGRAFKSKKAISLSTIHKVKGLEANRVFILDYDLLPIQRQEQQDWEVEQERNLVYVALTRAKEQLFLVDSE